MTACLLCFWKFTQIGVASKWNHTSPLGKVSQPICTEILWATFQYVSTSEIYGARFSQFPYFRPSYCQINVFLGLLEIGHVSRFADLFTNWKCCLIDLWSRAKVDRIYLAVNLVLSLFLKWLRNTGICKKHAKPIFVKQIYWIAYWIAYWSLVVPAWDCMVW